MVEIKHNGRTHIGSEAAVHSLTTVLNAASREADSVKSDNFGGFTIEWKTAESALLVGVSGGGRLGAMVRLNSDTISEDESDELSMIRLAVIEAMSLQREDQDELAHW